MTKNFKKTIWLAILFAALTVIVFGTSYFKNQPPQKQSIFSSLNFDKISKIEIKDPQKNVVLEKNGDEWFVGETKADPELVKNLIKEVEKIKDGELISTNPEKKKNFGLDEKATQIKIYQDNSLALDIFVGRFSPEQYGQYLRKNNEDKVYLVKAYLAPVIEQDFRDLKIIKFQKEEISKLQWQYPKENFSLSKDKEEWKINSKTAKKEIVESFLNELVNLSATDLLTDKKDEDAGLVKPQLKLIVTADDKNNEILFGKEEQTKIYLKIAGEKMVYLIDNYLKDELFKKAKDFE